MNKNTEFNEHRHFSRVSFDGQAHLIKAENTWPCRIIDLSLKGALITKPDNLTVQSGDQFLLELILDNENEVIIRMQVSVSHVENNHIGFHCEHIDLDSITHLRRLVELNLGDAELLNRELSALGK